MATTRAEHVATTGQVSCPPLGSFYWPLTLMAFRGGALAGSPLREFFAEVREVESKRAVVETYEMGLTRLIDRAGLRREVGWSQHELGVPDSSDLPLQRWHQLLEAGFPFVGRVLLTGPQFASQHAAVAHAVLQPRSQDLKRARP